MVSEKLYWLVLIVGLSCFSAIVWIFIIPVSHDIGVNLFTESIFMVLAIVFLSLLYDLREKRRWKPIKDKIIKRLTIEQIENLFVLLQNLCEIPEGKCQNALLELSKMEKMVLRSDIVDFFFQQDNLQGYIEELGGISKGIHDIQIEYSKFLEPEIADCLMNLELYSQDLADRLRILATFKLANKNEEQRFFNENFAPLVGKAIKEVYKLYKMGIKTRFTQSLRFIVVPDRDFFR